MLEIKNLRQQYPNFDLDVSFTVAPDEVVSLIGPNGAGKTTTFRAILNLLTPDAGTISLFDTPVAALSRAQREQIGATFPDSFFAASFTPKQLAQILQASYTKFDRQAFLAACTAQQLPLAQPFQDFSTGMKAKLKLLVAMSHQADFLVLDEPTSGLDVIVRQQVLAMLQDYLDTKPGRSVLLSSHIATDLETLCDRVLLIDQGRLVHTVTIDDLQTHYATLSLTQAQFAAIDQTYLLASKVRPFGIQALTTQRDFYQENYPNVANTPATVDDLLLLLTKEAAQ